ncbi:MAG: L-serine ammonia-lyase, iron-sulfur-dependent, subunit alpha [Pseudomonadota bacterium]
MTRASTRTATRWGSPHSGGRSGILQALAIGAQLPDPGAGLECFKEITPTLLARAEAMLAADGVTVQVDPSRRDLFVDCRVQGTEGTGRAVIEGEHTRLIRLERDGAAVPLPGGDGDTADPGSGPVREALAALSFHGLIALAESLQPADAERLNEGIAMNVAIARHGLTLFPRRFIQLTGNDLESQLSRLVCAGVYARMSGEDLPVMSLAGSGNKGITTTVPLHLWAEAQGIDETRTLSGLALALLVTSATTHHLGTLSAVCGCSNAAGIGLAAGLVYLEEGDEEAMSLALNNMVGNVSGMICDGAKIGCALKTMTSVDAAFRAMSLALSGIGIPVSDGIVGRNGVESLRNLGRIATNGMTTMDTEILEIMEEKLRDGSMRGGTR